MSFADIQIVSAMVLTTLASAWSSFLTYQRNFDSDPWSEWATAHIEIPIYLVGIYLLTVFEVTYMTTVSL